MRRAFLFRHLPPIPRRYGPGITPQAHACFSSRLLPVGHALSVVIRLVLPGHAELKHRRVDVLPIDGDAADRPAEPVRPYALDGTLLVEHHARARMLRAIRKQLAHFRRVDRVQSDFRLPLARGRLHQQRHAVAIVNEE